MNDYRPPSYVPTAYRPCNNPAVCSSFVLHPTLAVGAVGIVASSTDGLSSLSVYPSARAPLMHLASDYIYPYRCVGGSCSQRRTPRRVGRDNSVRPRLVCASQRQQTPGIPLVVP